MLNLIGLILAIEEKWQYPRERTSALCLGNLLAAILVRNELFGRILYLLVNKFFAKVRRKCSHLSTSLTRSHESVDPLVVPSYLYFCPPTPRWNPFWLRDIWFCVAGLPPRAEIQSSKEQ